MKKEIRLRCPYCKRYNTAGHILAHEGRNVKKTYSDPERQRRSDRCHRLVAKKRAEAAAERLRLNGDFDPTSRAAKHFWDTRVKVGGPDECWPWIGVLSEDGYGKKPWMVGGVRRKLVASKIAFLLSGGVLTPEKPYVLHSCDKPSCMNPKHLRSGNQKDNMTDMDARGRRGFTRGQVHAKSKFTDDQVRDIRKRRSEGVRWCDLAKEYNVSSTAIMYVVNKGWRHVK